MAYDWNGFKCFANFPYHLWSQICVYHKIDVLSHKSTRGIIEFDRKSSATRAIEQVNNGCFFLTKSPRAIVAAQIEAEDADDGLREVNRLLSVVFWLEIKLLKL